MGFFYSGKIIVNIVYSLRYSMKITDIFAEIFIILSIVTEREIFVK